MLLYFIVYIPLYVLDWNMPSSGRLNHKRNMMFIYINTNIDLFMFCWPCISIYACNETNLMLCLSSVYSVTIPRASPCFGLASSPSSWGNSVYVQRIVCVAHFSLLSVGLVSWVNVTSTYAYNTYQLSHIFIVTSWWWANSKPETCISIVTG
jgi:hypothetical protein